MTDLIKPLCKNHSGSATVLYGATTFSCTPEGYRKDTGRMPEGCRKDTTIAVRDLRYFVA